MNDHSATPTPTRDSQPELTRRLDLLAETTTMDVDAAWDDIQARIAASGRGQPGMRRRVLLAVAAAVLLVVGVTVFLDRDRDDGRVRTADRTTTTDRTTSSTSRRSTTPSTASLPPGAAPSGAGGPATGASGGAASHGSGAADPGSGSSPGHLDGGPDPGGPTPGPTVPATRLNPVASTWSALDPTQIGPNDYEVELVYAGSLYFRRVDDVGATPGPPDGHGFVDSWALGGIADGIYGAPGCLATSGGVYQFPGTGPVPFIWGVAGPDIASITITIGGQPTVYTGPALPLYASGSPGKGGTGSVLHAWVIALPPGPVERIEGSDAQANTVATITNPSDGYSGSAAC